MHLVDRGHIQWDALRRSLTLLARQEAELLANAHARLVRYYQRISGYRYHEQDGDDEAKAEQATGKKVSVRLQDTVRTLKLIRIRDTFRAATFKDCDWFGVWHGHGAAHAPSHLCVT